MQGFSLFFLSQNLTLYSSVALNRSLTKSKGFYKSQNKLSIPIIFGNIEPASRNQINNLKGFFSNWKRTFNETNKPTMPKISLTILVQVLLVYSYDEW